MDLTNVREQSVHQDGLRVFIDRSLSGTAIVACLATLKLLIHLLTAANYGLFVDELYFLACGEHLSWGYVDMPPLTAAQAWLARRLFGDSMYGIHLFPALAGAGLVLMVGAITRQLGGGRYAQGLAALAALIAPGWLAVHAYLSMNSIELLIVAGFAMVIIRMIKTRDPRMWLAFGVLAGIGLLNKHTILLFGFSVIAGLFLTRDRWLLFNRWFVLGGVIALLIFLPNLVWIWQHHFPHLEQLANIRSDQRNVNPTPFGFIGQQILLMHPATLPIWVGGLWRFLFGRDALRDPSQGTSRFAVLGLSYLIALGILIAIGGRTYYLLPAYPALFAGGAVSIEKWFKGSGLPWLKPVYVGVLVITGAMLAPLAMPLLPPETYIKYTTTLGISPPALETRRTSALPQLFADRFGWPEMARAVANAYNAIPEPERSGTAIFGQDYGQAGAIDFYGPKLGLPKAISGHLSYWYWGPRDYTGETMLVMGDQRDVLEQKFESVEKVGEVGHPYAMASQHWELFLCRRPKGWSNLQEIWPELKNWH